MIETKNRKDNAKELKEPIIEKIDVADDTTDTTEAVSLFKQAMEEAKKGPKIKEEEQLTQFEKDEIDKKILYMYDLITEETKNINDNLLYIKQNIKKNNIKMINETSDLISQIDFNKANRFVDYDKFINWYKNKYPKDYKNLPKNYDNQKYGWLEMKFTDDDKKLIKNLLNKNNIKLPDTKKLEKELNKLK